MKEHRNTSKELRISTASGGKLLTSRVRWLIALALILLASVSAVAADIDKLIKDLDDNSFAVRSKAVAELQKLLPDMTPQDAGKLLAAYANKPSVEAERRLQPLLAKYFKEVFEENQPVGFKQATGLVQVQITSSGKGSVGFVFGTVKGFSDLQGTANDLTVFTNLLNTWLTYRNSAGFGCVPCSVKALDAMEAFIGRLKDPEFNSLTLKKNKGKDDASRDDLYKEIRKAREMIKLQEKAIQKLGLLPGPEMLKTLQIAASGPVDLGKTVAMNIESVLTPGAVDYSWCDLDLADGPAPDGFVSYGPIYGMEADQSLQVQGAITFSIQYGDSEGDAYGISDPSQLAIVRIADGEYQVLDSSNDLGNHTITGVYKVDSFSQGPDQLGEFMLVGPASLGSTKINFLQAGQRTVVVLSDRAPLQVGR